MSHVESADTPVNFSDIDTFINGLRNGYFADKVGYLPLLVLDRESNALRRAREKGLRPEQIPSQLLVHDAAGFHGKIAQPTIRSVPSSAELPAFQSGLDRRSLRSAVVEAEIVDFPESSQYARKYTLYLLHPNGSSYLPRDVYQQALEFYSPKALRERRHLYVASKRISYGSQVDQAAITASIKRAQTRDWQAARFPLQGGAPGLSRRA